MNENQNDFLDYVVYQICPAVFTTQTATDEYHLHSTDKQKGRPEVFTLRAAFYCFDFMLLLALKNI